MVYLGGPSGEEFSPRETGHLNDHERRALDRFRCPVCDAPLDLMESAPKRRNLLTEERCELIAACRLCDVTFTQDAWHAWLGVA
ncbi:MAG TPA: hypothetical protein VNP95_00800 [Thermomicrobiales bacterium]|nr:hypothetical protein [Thermomicrobiales bacterium]